MRRTSSSSGTSSSRMWLRRLPSPPKSLSTSSACAAVRGKPSNTAPFLASGLLSSALMSSRIRVSGTSCPWSMNFLASRPSVVPSLTAARRMSPVVILGSCRRSARIFPCVPFPEPGAPRIRTNTPLLRTAAELDSAFLHEAVVVPEEEILLHLLNGIQRHAHHDQQRRAPEAERHVEHVPDDDRQHRDEREKDGAGQGDPGQDLVDIVGGRRPGLHARDKAALLLEVLRQVHGVEDDGRVEVGEEHEQ